MKKNTYGISALVIGIIALGLAVIPGIALDRPSVIPFTENENPPPPPPDDEGGLTLKYKKLSVTIGGGKKDKDKHKEDDGYIAAEIDQQDKTDRLLKWFMLSAVSCSLIGLILGPISWVREKQPVLAGSAIGCCCLALVWQYVVIGIIVGVAIAVLLMILSHM